MASRARSRRRFRSSTSRLTVQRYAIRSVCSALRRERIGALAAIKHRPADVVPQPLVVEDQLANRLRELVALPPTLNSACALGVSCLRGSTRRLDRIRRRTGLMRGDVCDGRCLAGSVCGVPCGPTQVPGRGIRMAGRRASLAHRDLSVRPGPPEFDRATRPIVGWAYTLEVIQ